MEDIILEIILSILFLFGYLLVILVPFVMHKSHKKIMRCKKWFLISQGAALLIALFMMTTERNLIPIIGYLVLGGAGVLSGTAVLGGLVVSPEERSRKGKKLLKMGYWMFSIVVVLAILWVSIWWKEIYGLYR